MDRDSKRTEVTERILADTRSGREPQAIVQAAMRRIKDSFPEFYWVGVYLLFGDELRLGPFCGPVTEHVRIPVGRGVCGTAVAENRNQVIGDVRAVSNYLACNLFTRSEIVVLIRDPDDKSVVGQIDIDCTVPDRFGSDDEAFLDEIGRLLAPAIVAMRRHDRG
ncbi:MAG TPA: GAF domain-containing protein [Myxococcota bacterium]|nr:GAF domain-containing protein [Myxococcota bacterium]HOA12690.1 GAF domain-containing protein [Myxococcota bacterium]HOD00265.1 GAF domain-containing protein [Myxococcota bacterium]HOH76144.1 GAF domain-containing protein [Myxococcota bacterium]HPV03622.1 GAF domain-containing protein [Myxococcota bacterium]